MALDIKKSLDAALMPAAILIIVGAVSALVTQLIPTLAGVGVVVVFIDITLLTWAGYRGGILAGILAGGLFGLVITVIFLSAGLVTGSFANASAMNLVVGFILETITQILKGTAAGTICGAVGALIAFLRR